MDLYGDGDKYKKIGDALMDSFKISKSNCADGSCTDSQKTIGDLGMFNFGGISSKDDIDQIKSLGDRMLGKNKQG